ncbi:hypothetical protein [Chamaesiphon sp.]|uniref:hypothetical protein n=1 Tax=Chamaesiphon sp. TaxID=2814140 RepID=UPI0035942A70
MFAKILLSLVTLALTFSILPTHADAQCITKKQVLAEIQRNRKIRNLPPLFLEPKLPTTSNESVDVLRSLKVAPTMSIAYKTIAKTVAPEISPNISIDFGLDRYVNVAVKPFGYNCLVVVTYGELLNLSPN